MNAVPPIAAAAESELAAGRCADQRGGAGRRVDADDVVELRGSRATTEDVRKAADRNRGRVVPRRRQAADHAGAASACDEDLVGRLVGCGQASEQQGAPAGQRGNRRILERRGERAGDVLDEARRCATQSGESRRPLGDGCGGGAGRRRPGRSAQEPGAHHARCEDRHEDGQPRRAPPPPPSRSARGLHDPCLTALHETGMNGSASVHGPQPIHRQRSRLHRQLPEKGGTVSP